MGQWKAQAIAAMREPDPHYRQTMSQPQTEFDSPWKDGIESYFQDFIRFFCRQAHAEIEWSRGIEFLDKICQIRDFKSNFLHCTV